MKIFVKEGLVIILVISLFILSAYWSKFYGEDLKLLLGERGITGMVVYVLITIGAIVITPISTLPLLPVAVSLWGSFGATILSIISWTIGSMIAFWLASYYGRPIVKKFVSLEQIDRLSERMPKQNIFWSVVFLRMVIPVDILSYALGLFVPMPIGTYTLATLIGITPFAFVFSYATLAPLPYQIAAGALAISAILLSFVKIRKID